MFDYDIAVLTGLIPKEIEEYTLQNNIKTNTADKHWQMMLINGLKENNKGEIAVFSAPFIPDITKSKILKVKHTEDAGINYVGFNNIKYYKIFSRKKNIIKALKLWAKCDRGKEKLLIIYSMDSAFMKAMASIKKLFKNIKTYLIVLDLPEYMSLGNNVSFVYKTLKKIDKISINNSLEYVDKYILLTEHMVERFNAKNYVIVNGMVEKERGFDNSEHVDNEKFLIVYTGSLYEKFGVKTLVDAMEHISGDDIELCICGHGELESYIKNKAVVDARIKFFGQIPLEDAIKLQKRASLLVNPRPNEGEFIKYSFPSKMFEYLMIGVPILCYKLDCYGDYFDGVFNYVNGYSIKEMADRIVEIKNNYGYYLDKAIESKKEVAEKFNYYEQVKKMLVD